MLRDSHQSRYPQKIELIICSAVWYQEIELKKEAALRMFGGSPTNVDRGVVVCGWRHPNCRNIMMGLTGLRGVEPECGKYVQGFLTNNNRFVGREEAAQIALSGGQVEKLEYHSNRLFSEDLY